MKREGSFSKTKKHWYMSRSLWLFVLVAWVPPGIFGWRQHQAGCNHAHMHPVQLEEHLAEVATILNPIRNCAIMLARLPVRSEHLQRQHSLSQKLLRVYQRFHQSCHEHHWEEALTHKLCASFVRHETHVKTLCQNQVPMAASTWSEGCICAGLESMLQDCRHHVLPWHYHHNWGESETCAQIVNNHTHCGQVHPMGGLCAISKGRLQRKLARKRAKEETKWVSNHVKHNTKDKHRQWKQHAKSNTMLDVGKKILDRIHNHSTHSSY